MNIQYADAFILFAVLSLAPIFGLRTVLAHADGYMHFSWRFAVSSVKVTCKAGSLGHTGRSFRLPGVLFSKSSCESPFFGPLTSSEPCNVCTFGGLEPAGAPARDDPRLSDGYRKVCEVLTISRSSRDTSDGESREMMEEERWPSAQRNCPPPLRPRPPILQNRHLIFSISLRTTVFLSRM